jgi:competence protein ComEC
MPSQGKKHYLLALVLFLFFSVIYLVYLDMKSSQRVLTFAMLDVGQGDALFIESPSGIQLLFDAGPPRKIMGQLQRVMSPFDKTLDAVVVTNPDADHIGGLSEILKNYKVGMILEAGTWNDSKVFQNLKQEIENKKIPNVLAKKGMVLHLGDGARVDILFPDRDVYMWSPNEGSLVARLSYGETSIMLTGDSTSKTEKIILDTTVPSELLSDILKIGHHGSRSSTSTAFLKEVAPRYALISNGEDNNYGHPHREVLANILSSGAETLRTDLLGTIIMRSDGKKETFSFHK